MPKPHKGWFIATGHKRRAAVPRQQPVHRCRFAEQIQLKVFDPRVPVAALKEATISSAHASTKSPKSSPL